MAVAVAEVYGGGGGAVGFRTASGYPVTPGKYLYRDYWSRGIWRILAVVAEQAEPTPYLQESSRLAVAVADPLQIIMEDLGVPVEAV